MEKNNNIFHKSVLTKEVLKYLNIQPNKTYLDATFGGGGHTAAILEKESTCKVIALDWDKKTIENNIASFKKNYGERIKIIWGNFGHLQKILKKENIEKIDGIIADFGTSQFQIQHTPGLSFQKDTPLDMRISQAHYYWKASDILNRFSQKEISNILFEFGEEKNANKIAKAIVNQRIKEKFKTTGQLTKLIESLIPKYKNIKRKYYIHPATKTFQALRIFVNKELENINSFLKSSINFLNINSRIVCISFHSLEDRIVKNFFKENKNFLEIITKKPIMATKEEILQNPSSRSAKLRSAQRKEFFNELTY